MLKVRRGFPYAQIGLTLIGERVNREEYERGFLYDARTGACLPQR
jgi:hypothetical protein